MKFAVAFLIILAALVVFIYLVQSDTRPTPQISMEPSTLSISSPAFESSGRIPARYTCDGENISPELYITGVPEKAASLVLIVDDPDAPVGIWDHLLVFNIPAQSESLQSIPAEFFNSERGTGLWPSAKYGKNSWGRLGYGGPCPPSGAHRYIFKLYALDANLDLPVGVDKKTLEREMDGHILAKSELTGLYSRE